MSIKWNFGRLKLTCKLHLPTIIEIDVDNSINIRGEFYTFCYKSKCAIPS